MPPADDDTEQMRLAYQEFMLSGGGGKTEGKKKPKSNQTPPSTPATPHRNTKGTKSPQVVGGSSLSTQKRLQIQRQQKARRKYLQILTAFRNVVQNDWLATDDHLGDVMGSISNLRDRILRSSRQLSRARDRPAHPPVALRCGYRRPPEPVPNQALVIGSLTREDVEMALTHDLRQHEKMLSGARGLLASLHQAQEALGRRLDELMQYHLEEVSSSSTITLQQHSHDGNDDDTIELLEFSARLVEWSRQIFSELGLELYRKQCLVQSVLDSVADVMLFQDDNDLDVGEVDGLFQDELPPLKAAQRCHREWPRGSGQGSALLKLLLETPWTTVP